MMTDEEIKNFLSGINTDEEEMEQEQQTSIVRKIRWPVFEESSVKLKDRHNYDFIKDVKLNVAAELGKTELKAKEILNWQEGSIIELNKLAGEPVDLQINEQKLAKAEIIIINDNIGVRIVSLYDEHEQCGQ